MLTAAGLPAETVHKVRCYRPVLALQAALCTAHAVATSHCTSSAVHCTCSPMHTAAAVATQGTVLKVSTSVAGSPMHRACSSSSITLHMQQQRQQWAAGKWGRLQQHTAHAAPAAAHCTGSPAHCACSSSASAVHMQQSHTAHAAAHAPPCIAHAAAAQLATCAGWAGKQGLPEGKQSLAASTRADGQLISCLACSAGRAPVACT